MAISGAFTPGALYIHNSILIITIFPEIAANIAGEPGRIC